MCDMSGFIPDIKSTVNTYQFPCEISAFLFFVFFFSFPFLGPLPQRYISLCIQSTSLLKLGECGYRKPLVVKVFGSFDGCSSFDGDWRGGWSGFYKI